MFNNHFMPMPNFSVPPPSRHPPPLNSTRVFFPSISQPQQLLYPRPFAQPHMNPQFFNLSVPPPPIPRLITNLIASNLHTFTNQTRPPINVAHQITTSDRFSKLRPVGREKSGFVHGDCLPNSTKKKRSERNLSEERRTFELLTDESRNRFGASEELRIELSGVSRKQSLLKTNADDDNHGNETADDSPNSKESGCSENSQESIHLVPTDNDSDGEHPEMGRNWRMLMLFNGFVKDKDLTPNCERPQTEVGRTYPDIQRKTAPQNAEEQRNVQQEHQLLKGPGTSQEMASSGNTNGFGYATPSSNVWVSSELLAKMHQQQQQTNSITTRNSTIIPNCHSFSSSTSFGPNNHQLVVSKSSDSRTRKRFYNQSLVIFKNGKRLYAGSKDCFQFLETGTCLSGVFCEFEHDGSAEHAAKKVCPSLMRGQCRNLGDTCPDGPHSTLMQHQMPVCDYYLRMCCSKGKDQCPYLHVKHTDGMDPCDEFNKGCCQQGVMCNLPHRYRYHRIKEKQMERSKLSANLQEYGTDRHKNLHSTPTGSKNDTLKWFS